MPDDASADAACSDWLVPEGGISIPAEGALRLPPRCGKPVVQTCLHPDFGTVEAYHCEEHRHE